MIKATTYNILQAQRYLFKNPDKTLHAFYNLELGLVGINYEGDIVFCGSGKPLVDVFSYEDLIKFTFYELSEKGSFVKTTSLQETLERILKGVKMRDSKGEEYNNYRSTMMLERVFEVNNLYRDYLNNDLEFWVEE